MMMRSAVVSRVRGALGSGGSSIGGVRTTMGLVTLAMSLWAAVAPAEAQQGSPPPIQTFTLGQALHYALEHYPTVRAALEQITVASANVSIARGGYLPRFE